MTIAQDYLIKRLEAKIEELELRPFLKDFAQILGANLLTILCQKPYAEWSQSEKSAYTWAAERMPTVARVWKDRLPKERL
jgi:hypothetical protein